MKLSEFKFDQKLVGIYSIMGTVCGFISNYLTATNLSYSLMIPLGVYALSAVPLLRMTKEHKTQKVVSNSILTFLLVWIMVWVFLYNI